MTLFDAVRYLVFAFFGVGVGFMILTNALAFMVLRVPKKLGFLWWHVTSVSLSFFGIGVIATERVAGRLGDPPGWQSLVTVLSMALFCAAQWIIFGVERQRYITSRATDIAAKASPPGTFSGP